jgi:phosphoglycolate phosphatase
MRPETETALRAIVFDLDGTLIDSAPDICALGSAVLSGEGAAPLTLAETRSFIGNGAGVFVTRMMTARGLPEADHSRLLAAFLRNYDDAKDLTTLYPGVTEALSALADDGCALGICTNKPLTATKAILAHLGLLDRFATIIGGDSLPERKPHPAPLLRAFADLSSTAPLFVGDSEIDYATAEAAGVPIALYIPGYRAIPLSALPAAIPFDHFAELPALARRLIPSRSAP